MSDFRSLLFEGAHKLQIELTDEAVDRLESHRVELQRWASKMNLTTVSGTRDMAERLYLDSAVVCSALPRGCSLHDVGSGAGFPGLVIKALRPDLVITLTEARRKRVSFLKQAARVMGLGEGLQIRWSRLGWESEEDQGLGPWDEVISRATFPPDIWLEKGAPLVGPGGRLWVMAGQPHGNGDSQPSWSELAMGPGFAAPEVKSYRLPFCGLERWLVSFRARA